jgi:hypothetical protein
MTTSSATARPLTSTTPRGANEPLDARYLAQEVLFMANLPIELWRSVKSWRGTITYTHDGEVSALTGTETSSETVENLDLSTRTAHATGEFVTWQGRGEARLTTTAIVRIPADPPDPDLVVTANGSGEGEASVELQFGIEPDVLPPAVQHIVNVFGVDPDKVKHDPSWITVRLGAPPETVVTTGGPIHKKETLAADPDWQSLIFALPPPAETNGDQHVTLPVLVTPDYTVPGGFAGIPVTLNRQHAKCELVADLKAVRTVDIWLNVFIPGEGGGAKAVPGTGPYSGKKMIDGPPGSGCFLTDSRGFSDDPEASSRLRLKLTVDLPAATVSHEALPGQTVELSCADGAVLRTGRTKTNRVKVKAPVVTKAGHDIRVPFTIAVADPLVTLAAVVGDVDANGVIQLVVSNTWDEVQVSVKGKVDGYPAFEAYARLRDGENTGPTSELFRTPLPPGASPYNLVGLANRSIEGRATFKAF